MLNKQGPGKIDWCDYTWNPISGKCKNNCPYCYMHGLWKRFPELAKLQLREKYLSDKMPKKPSKIFVGSSTDMWGDWIDRAWINAVFVKVRKHPQHIFQFLSKNPEEYETWDFSDLGNCWFGTSMDGLNETEDNLFHLIHGVFDDLIKFVSFEPLIKQPKASSLFDSYFEKLDWIIIGADSSIGAKKPPKEWADYLIQTARSFNIPVWIKDNYNYPEVIKEFPQQ